MKRQLFAISFATISALSTFSLLSSASAQIAQSKTITVRVDSASTANGIAFDSGSSLEAQPDMLARVFVENQRIGQSSAPDNRVAASFNLQTDGKSDKALVPVRVELYDRDDSTQEAIDINPLAGLKVLNLRYEPATGNIINERGAKVGDRGTLFDLEGLGDGDKKATIRLSITHR